MFNINRILNRKVDSGRSPVRSASVILDGKGGSAEVNNAEDSTEGRNAEGFLCPSCYLAFPTADSLQNHYESTHSENFANLVVDGRVFSCPACKMCLGSEAELHSHYKRHHSNEKEQGEIEALRTQVTALQDGKQLVVDELQSLHAQLMDLFKENAKIREERDAFEQKTASLAGELAFLKADFDESKSRKTCLELKLVQAEARVRELEIEIQQRPEADDVSLLKQEIVSVQKMMDQLTLQREAEKDALQRQCSNLQEFCTRLQAENASLEESLKSASKNDILKSMDEEISAMKSRIADLQKNFDVAAAEKAELEVSIKQFSDYEDLKRDLAHKEGLLNSVNQLLETKEEAIKKLTADLKAEKENVERMKEGAEQLFAKIEEGEGANTAILQLKEENARLHEQIIHEQNLVVQVQHDMEVKLENLQIELFKKAKQEVEMFRMKKSELESELSKIQNRFDGVEKENKQLNVQLTEQDKKLSQLKDSHKNSLLSLQIELESTKMSLSKKSEYLEAREKSLQKSEEQRAEQVKAQVQLKDSLGSVTTELAKLKALRSSETSEMKSKVEQLEKEKGELISKCNAEKEKSAHLSSRYHDLNTQYESMVSKLKDATQQIADSQSIKSDLEAKLSQLKEEVQKNQDNEAQLLLTIGDLNEIKKQLSEKIIHCDEEAKDLRTAIDSLRREKETMLKQIEVMTSEISERKVLCDFQENKIAELTECYHDEKENRCREVQSLESAKQLLISQKMALLKDIEAIKEENAKQVANLQERISALESEVQKAQATNRTLTAKLENAVQSNKRNKEEWDKLQSHLEAQIGVLTENANTLREDLHAEQSKKEALEQKVDELSGSKLELEAKLENALDERRSLLDRCLKRESECEKLQKSTADLRRKLDDTTAALQELGRENQTLQIENTKHLARKWTDDHEVTHCTACGKLFTVTVRKHHCRNCGNIFCNECSSRTAAIASSKKPVRVCDLCYAEVSK